MLLTKKWPTPQIPHSCPGTGQLGVGSRNSSFLERGAGTPFLGLSNTLTLHRSKHLEYSKLLGKGGQEGITISCNKHSAAPPSLLTPLLSTPDLRMLSFIGDVQVFPLQPSDLSARERLKHCPLHQGLQLSPPCSQEGSTREYLLTRHSKGLWNLSDCLSSRRAGSSLAVISSYIVTQF